MADEDERFMTLALELAGRGRGAVEPNPMVGAVLARGQEELARGWHQRFGSPHAEVEALSSAAAAGVDSRGATMYVTLEPCCHHGKTPPCTEALIAAGLARVVVAIEDVDSHVAGRGIAALRAAGIEVAIGVCRDQTRRLLAPYIKLRTAHRPWVLCKWAQTAEGFLALPAGQGRWISSPASRQHGHRLRGLCQGVCVGVGTVLADDPLLTNRSGAGRAPLRIVLDATLRMPPACRLVATASQSPVLVATTPAAIAAQERVAQELTRAGVEVLALPPAAGSADRPRVDPGALLDELGRREHTYLLV
ncbi:MAG: bifunctional diaminohydroxyphosphoribosylaminopyrimidine deaminase/5-amino-6-(5-phosphoribosylamino)uracil reductase RibD [Phycisphaerae bacterium]|nr:bifunctional diaminohydroxyphosphoribosylaminopyrimidine deaminase/5-amino-6-(5-phosphoribosylamino)uracil reductase RibD [Phycisphaerae bacterium]